MTEVVMKHKVALVFIIISLALIAIGGLLGIKDAVVYLVERVVAVASVPAPAPQITNVYVTNNSGEKPSKSKKRSRKATQEDEVKATEPAPTTNQVPVPQPVREVVWKTPQSNTLSNNRFEIILPVHIQEFDSRIWANANQNVVVKYDSSSSRGRIRYEVAGEKLPIGEKKEGDSNNNWSDSIKIINEEPTNDASLKPYILIVTLEQPKPHYTHNDCVKLVHEVGGNLRQVPSECMTEWQDYQAEKEYKKELELAETRRQNERRQEELERERLHKQEQRDRMIQQGISTIDKLIKRR